MNYNYELQMFSTLKHLIYLFKCVITVLIEYDINQVQQKLLYLIMSIYFNRFPADEEVR